MPWIIEIGKKRIGVGHDDESKNNCDQFDTGGLGGIDVGPLLFRVEGDFKTGLW